MCWTLGLFRNLLDARRKFAFWRDAPPRRGLVRGQPSAQPHPEFTQRKCESFWTLPEASNVTALIPCSRHSSSLFIPTCPFPGEEIFKNPMTTAAAINRLVHHCIILELNIPSYRMEQAKKNRESALGAEEANWGRPPPLREEKKGKGRKNQRYVSEF